MARKGRTQVIYKGTFISKQSLVADSRKISVILALRQTCTKEQSEPITVAGICRGRAQKVF
jgi:hypothetical protein